MGTSELIVIVIIIAVLLWFVYEKTVKAASIDDGTLVEDKLDKNVIPTTRKWGIAGAFISGGIMIISSEIVSGIVVIVIGVSATLGFVTLLEGFSNIIRLLRKISEK